MCGFVGEYLLGGRGADLGLLQRLSLKLQHRGPDENGSFLSRNSSCAIGFRRLAIIDPPLSHQPMVSEDGLICLAFNGEIYNFRTLREELRGSGVGFTTAGDTEVLLRLYQRDGEGMVGRLEGMFAFAIYDSGKDRLLLARDPAGQKPLWYAMLDDRIVFASEAKAILAHPSVPHDVSDEFITHYCTLGYVDAPLSAWSRIHKLPPAHIMTLTGSQRRVRRYWAPAPPQPPASKGEAVEMVRRKLTESVRSHMVSDVPLGALLSGGIDSSIIVAIMSTLAGKAGGVRTFTAGFEDDRFDERPQARAVAEHCRTEHTELLVKPSPLEMVDRVVEMYDEPFGDSSAIPTFLVCQAARQHVKVALTGDGGDEAFGGYDRYRALLMAEGMGTAKYLAVQLAAGVARIFAGHEERSKLRRVIRFAEALSQPYATQYFMYRRLFGPKDLARLFTDDYAAKVDLDAPGRVFCERFEEGDFDSEATRAQQMDLLSYLPGDLLVKTDIASMASSLELRAPMLATDVVNFGLSLPVSMKMSASQGKLILRQAFSGMLPQSVLKLEKRGFGVPLGDWLRGPLAPMLRETLLDSALLDMDIFRPDSLAGLINDHISGLDDHRHRLWALLILARWLLKHRR